MDCIIETQEEFNTIVDLAIQFNNGVIHFNGCKIRCHLKLNFYHPPCSLYFLFTEAIFYEPVNIKAEGAISFDFTNAVFNRGFVFHDSELTPIELPLTFTNAIFKKRVHFRLSDFHTEVRFNQVQFLSKEIYFSNVTFQENVKFTGAIFGTLNSRDEMVKFLYCNFSKEASFSYAAFFSSALIIYNTHFKEKSNFKYTYFGGTCEFSDSEILGDVSYKHSTYLNKLLLNKVKIGGVCDFRQAQFRKESPFKISGCEFKDKINFSNCHFRNIEISATHFHETVDIRLCNFREEIIFQNIDFKREIIFNKDRFTKSVLFQNCILCDAFSLSAISSWEDCPLPSFIFKSIRIEKTFTLDFELLRKMKYLSKPPFKNLTECISFENCSFENTSNTILNHIYGSENSIINFDQANIMGNLVLQNIQMEQISMENTIVTGDISIVDSVKFQKVGGRHSACLLKNEMLKINDKINFLEYKKFEMQEYKKSLTKQLHKLPTFSKKTNYIYCELFLLWLNEHSNDFGRNWFRGIIFTTICGFVFYLLFLIPYHLDKIILLFSQSGPILWPIGIDIANLFSYFWLLNFLGPLSQWIESLDFHLWWTWPQVFLGALIYLLGKIAIGYGIYQTIAAFRKHAK